MLKIISGGQTGVDRGALDAALDLGVECGGWCPARRLAEDGTIPERYPVTEMPTANYSARTEQNVAESGGTLIICMSEPIGGTRETVDCCRQMGKPHLVLDCEQLSLEEARRLHPIVVFVDEQNRRVSDPASPVPRVMRLGGPNN